MTQDLSGKRIWITGAGAGIGAALAEELAACGARLALTGRTRAALDSVAERVIGRGGRALVLPGDVTDAEAMRAAAARAEAELGGLDILVANAGDYIESWPERFDAAEYLRLMQVNFGGVLHCMQAVIPGMQARGGGTIVGMASLAGYRGLPRSAAYGASKAALIHFLESASFHLRRRGIRVVIVNPGFVKTRLTDQNDFHMPCLMTPARAARYIRRGLEQGRAKIAFPPPFSWLLELTRMLPYPLYDFLVYRKWLSMERKASR